MYALVAAHVSHLLLNWGNDSFVLVQRIEWFSKEDHSTRKQTPFALPSVVSVKWIRLSVAAIVLILMSIDFSKCGIQCPTSVSHAAHFFGALGGFLTGIIFLEARHKNKWIQVGKVVFLVLVYGGCIFAIVFNYYRESSKEPGKICSWSEYERTCQKYCYGANVTETCTEMNLCRSVSVNKCKSMIY